MVPPPKRIRPMRATKARLDRGGSNRKKLVSPLEPSWIGDIDLAGYKIHPTGPDSWPVPHGILRVRLFC